MGVSPMRAVLVGEHFTHGQDRRTTGAPPRTIPIHRAVDKLSARVTNPTRKQYLSPVRTMVIKLGTQVLSDAQGRLDSAFLGTIAAQVAGLGARGIRATLVSSGAIGAGLRELNLP